MYSNIALHIENVISLQIGLKIITFFDKMPLFAFLLFDTGCPMILFFVPDVSKPV